MESPGDIAFVSFSSKQPTAVSICVKDLDSGEVLMTYTGGSCSRGTLNLLRQGYLIGACEHKPIIYMWVLNKKDPIQRVWTPGRVGCLSACQSSSFCVGSIDEKLYLWTVATGNLNRIIEHHLIRVTCIKFSTSGLDFVTCDEHGGVFLWNVLGILCHKISETPRPLATFSGHTSKVTDAHLNDTRLTTSSLDRTVRVWEVYSGQLVRSFSYDRPVVCVSMDATCRYVAAGFDDGEIKVDDIEIAAASDGVPSSDGSNSRNFFFASEITSLSWTEDGSLVAGNSGGCFLTLNLESNHGNERFSHRGAVTNIILTPFLPNRWNDPVVPVDHKIPPLSIQLNTEPNLIVEPPVKQISLKRKSQSDHHHHHLLSPLFLTTAKGIAAEVEEQEEEEEPKEKIRPIEKQHYMQIVKCILK